MVLLIFVLGLPLFSKGLCVAYLSRGEPELNAPNHQFFMLKNKNIILWACPCQYIDVICQRMWACPYVNISMLSVRDCGRVHMSIYRCYLSEIVGVSICRYIDVICYRLWACPSCGRVRRWSKRCVRFTRTSPSARSSYRQTLTRESQRWVQASGFCPGHFRSLISS